MSTPTPEVDARPRGIRNNNPGNIRAVPTYTWQGEVGADDKGFCVFSAPEFGLRAMLIIFHNYQEYHGLTTTEQLIQRYAPASENDVGSYVSDVAAHIGLRPDSRVYIDAIPAAWASAIVRHECGCDPYTASVYATASRLAFDRR